MPGLTDTAVSEEVQEAAGPVGRVSVRETLHQISINMRSDGGGFMSRVLWGLVLVLFRVIKGLTGG